MKEEKYLGRIVKEKHTFKVEGTFQGLYAAQDWCRKNGYEYGSTDIGNKVALQYGQYDLPQKWKNFDDEDKTFIDGVMVSYDFREGEVIVYIFN